MLHFLYWFKHTSSSNPPLLAGCDSSGHRPEPCCPQLSQCPDAAWPTSRLYSTILERPPLLALIIFVSTCAWLPRKLLWHWCPCVGRGHWGVFEWEGEKENRRNGTMKTLSHQETEAASGDMTDRRSWERLGKRKELWQPRAQRRPTESSTLSACCLTQWKDIKIYFLKVYILLGLSYSWRTLVQNRGKGWNGISQWHSVFGRLHQCPRKWWKKDFLQYKPTKNLLKPENEREQKWNGGLSSLCSSAGIKNITEL